MLSEVLKEGIYCSLALTDLDMGQGQLLSSETAHNWL